MTPLTIENAHEVLELHVPKPVIDAIVTALTWANTATGNAYAAAYLKELDRAGRFSQRRGEGYEYGVKVNLLYAIGNLAQWRGEEARNTKAILRRYTNGI